jgi:putative ABC transport system permease protein
MIRNYFKIAFRTLLRNKSYAFINITGLALGLAACIVIFLVVQNELSYDHYHANADRTYRVTLLRLHLLSETISRKQRFRNITTRKVDW